MTIDWFHTVQVSAPTSAPAAAAPIRGPRRGTSVSSHRSATRNQSAAVAALSSGQALKSNTGQIYETESAYNYIQVAEQNGFTILRLNEGQGVHSIYHPDTLQYNGPWDQFLVSPYFYAGRRPADVQRRERQERAAAGPSCCYMWYA